MLIKVDAPNTTSISSKAFKGCINLRYIDYPKVKSISSDAFNTGKVKHINLENAVKISSLGLGYTSLYLPKCEELNCSIGGLNCKYVYLPECTTMTGYIYGEKIEEAYLPKLERLEDAFNAQYQFPLFYNCYNLKAIDLPSLNYVSDTRLLFRIDSRTQEFALNYVYTPKFNPTKDIHDYLRWLNEKTSKYEPIEADEYTIGRLEANNTNNGIAANENEVFNVSIKSSSDFNLYTDNQSIKAKYVNNNYVVNTSVKSGKYITICCDNDTFEAIIDVNSRVKSTKNSHTFRVQGNINYLIKSKEEGTVSFYNANGDLIETKRASCFTEDDYPTAPDYYGHNFVGWSMNVDEINEAVKNGESVRVEAKFEKKMKYYSLTLYGGEVTEENSDYENGEDSYREFSLITIKPTYTDKTKFVCWKDGNGSIISYDEVYRFYMSSDITIYAVYDDENVQKEALTRITNAIIDADNGKITFIAEREIPDECRVISHGIIMTSNATLNDDTFVIGASGVLKGTSVTTGNRGTYTLYKSNVQTGETWYARSYVIYSDKDEKIYTKYSNIYSATME